MKTRLDQYNNDWFKPTIQASTAKQLLWYCVNWIIFTNSINISSSFKVFLLRKFGAKVGNGVIIKPRVNIKYPWKLEIGNHVWIGENVWIDNLTNVKIGDQVCISQGAMLLTGNHNYKKASFDLIVKEIVLEEGVWVGAQSVVCPGTIAQSHSILTVGSVGNGVLLPYTIYQGNPAKPIRTRTIEDNRFI